ncbi:MAG: hypothetical protein ACI9IV_000912, partial [Paracoccaceae bacterium]
THGTGLAHRCNGDVDCNRAWDDVGGELRQLT